MKRGKYFTCEPDREIGVLLGGALFQLIDTDKLAVTITVSSNCVVLSPEETAALRRYLGPSVERRRIASPGRRTPFPAFGQVWRDRDPRRSGRTITLTYVGSYFVYFTNARGEERKISIDRLQPWGLTKGYEFVR